MVILNTPAMQESRAFKGNCCAIEPQLARLLYKIEKRYLTAPLFLYFN